MGLEVISSLYRASGSLTGDGFAVSSTGGTDHYPIHHFLRDDHHILSGGAQVGCGAGRQNNDEQLTSL